MPVMSIKIALTMPTMSESMILPVKKPPKISWPWRAVSMTIFAVFGLQNAKSSFFVCPRNLSLSQRT